MGSLKQAKSKGQWANIWWKHRYYIRCHCVVCDCTAFTEACQMKCPFGSQGTIRAHGAFSVHFSQALHGWKTVRLNLVAFSKEYCVFVQWYIIDLLQFIIGLLLYLVMSITYNRQWFLRLFCQGLPPYLTVLGLVKNSNSEVWSLFKFHAFFVLL